MQPDQHRGDDAEIATAAANGPEQVGLLVGTGGDASAQFTRRDRFGLGRFADDAHESPPVAKPGRQARTVSGAHYGRISGILDRVTSVARQRTARTHGKSPALPFTAVNGGDE
jgi:hypothetical protein